MHGREVFHLLKETLHLIRVMEQHGIQLNECGRGVVEEGLASVYCIEPTCLKKLSNTALDVFLLSVKTALSSLDARDEIADGNTQRPDNSKPPFLIAGGLRRRGFDFGKAGQQSFRQEAEALARECFVVKEEFNDGISEGS
jgi:hypothetical protein